MNCTTTFGLAALVALGACVLDGDEADHDLAMSEQAATVVPFGVPAGYQFVDSHPYEWTDVSTTGIELRPADDGAELVELPFEFSFYGTAYTSLAVASNGVIAFADTDKFPAGNADLPVDLSEAQAFIAVHWDDILPLLSSAISYQVDGEEPSRSITIQWKDVAHYDYPGVEPGASFGVVLYERTNLIVLQYESLDFGVEEDNFGGSATVGTQASAGFAQVYSFNAPSLADQSAILIQVEGCGADDTCEVTCGYDPDCPVCIADDECNSECAEDPDCPVCIMDEVCNEECDDDPDCSTVEPPAACIADDVCDEACEADPDCENCEANDVCNPRCDVDPDCDGGCAVRSGNDGDPRAWLAFGLAVLVIVRRRGR